MAKTTRTNKQPSHKRSKSELIAVGVDWVEDNLRWPSAHTSPVASSTATRVFGSWNTYKEAVRRAFLKKHGEVPDWDRPIGKTTPLREALLTEIADVVDDTIASINALPPYAPKRAAKKSTKKPRGRPNEMHLIISDVHVGERNEPELMANLMGDRGYSFSVFEEASETLSERVQYFHECYSSVFPINKLVINFIGDIVTGESIFIGQQLQIDKIVSDQIFEGAHRFAGIFTYWASMFDTVEVYCISGNHGRVGRKGELHYRTNFDYILYRVTAALCANVKNMRWVIGEGPSLVVEHGHGWNFLLHHGDSIPGAGVTKANYGSLEKKVNHFAAMANIPIHYSLCGHYHRSASIGLAGGGRLIVNGSFPGGSPFSVEVLSDAQVPSQKLLILDPKYGVHSETDIILGQRPQLVKDDLRVYTRNYRTSA